MNTKFGFATDIKTILFFVHHKNYGRIEIVGILLTRLKYMSGSENVYMQIIGCLIFTTNNFKNQSKELMCIYSKNCG